MESENLTKEPRVSESTQEIFDSIHGKYGNYTYVYHMSTLFQSWCGGKYYKNEGILLGGYLTVKNWWGLLSGDGGGLVLGKITVSILFNNLS